MNTINGNTVFQVTTKQLFLGVGTLFGAIAFLFAVAGYFASITFGQIGENVADIRAAVTHTQDRNTDTLQKTVQIDTDLRAQIANLTAELRVTNAGLSDLTASMGDLNNSVKVMDARLERSIARQASFERWVVTRIGQTNVPVPMNWQQPEGEIINSLSQGDNPLLEWSKLATGQ